MGFQKQVNLQQAPAVAGDFASNNPRAAKVAGEGALVAGEGGVIVGRFAWVVNGVVTNSGTGKPHGFVHRSNNALITEWLGESSNVIPQGLPVTLFNAGDFWAVPTMPCLPGWFVFASPSTGEVYAGSDPNTPPADFVETGFIVGDATYTGTFPNELVKITTWGA